MIKFSPEQEQFMDELIDINGIEHHKKKLKEECAELIVAISHFEEGKITLSALLEEIADVLIVTTQHARFVGEEEVQKEVDHKMGRLKLKYSEYGEAISV